jgi:hypothetical protein
VGEGEKSAAVSRCASKNLTFMLAFGAEYGFMNIVAMSLLALDRK